MPEVMPITNSKATSNEQLYEPQGREPWKKMSKRPVNAGSELSYNRWYAGLPGHADVWTGQMNDPSPEKLKVRRRIRSTIVFQFALVCGLVAAALVLVPLFMYYAGMIPEVHDRDFADSPVQHAIDTYSLQAEGNITTLERIINKELNVPVTKNEEGNLVVEYEGTRTILDESYILSEEPVEEPAIVTEFGSVDELTASDSLSVGDVVRTASFYAGSGRGGATYDVVARTSETEPNGMSRLDLPNGLVAVIRPQNGMVSVDQLGAHADNETDDYPYIQAAFVLGFKTVSFEGGDYRFNHQLDIRHSDVTILGNGSTLHYYDFFIWESEDISNDYAIGAKGGSPSDPIENIYIQQLNVSNDRTDGESYNVGHNIVRISNAEHVEIFGCNLTALDHTVAGRKMEVAGIDMRTYWYDVIVESCTLINRTYAHAGGSIWIRGGAEGTGKLVIRNNYVEKSCHDETLAIFGQGVTEDGIEYGYVDDVLIENNEFYIDETNVSQPSTLVFSFGLDTRGISNIRFLNNDVTVKASDDIMTAFEATGVEVTGNTFDVTLVTYPEMPDMTGGIFTQRSTAKNMSVKDNTINVTATESAQMGYLARGVDDFYHNNVSITAPMGAMFGECVRVDENTISVDTSDFKNYIKDHISDEKYSFFSVYAWRDDVPDVISFTGNKITFNEQLFEYQDVRIVSVSDVDMGGMELNMSDDVVEGIGEGEEANKRMLSITGCQDTSGTSTIYALRNDSTLSDALDVSGDDDNGLSLVIDDESVLGLE